MSTDRPAKHPFKSFAAHNHSVEKTMFIFIPVFPRVLDNRTLVAMRLVVTVKSKDVPEGPRDSDCRSS
jgi:hypothetical protein